MPFREVFITSKECCRSVDEMVKSTSGLFWVDVLVAVLKKTISVGRNGLNKKNDTFKSIKSFHCFTFGLLQVSQSRQRDDGRGDDVGGVASAFGIVLLAGFNAAHDLGGTSCESERITGQRRERTLCYPTCPKEPERFRLWLTEPWAGAKPRNCDCESFCEGDDAFK